MKIKFCPNCGGKEITIVAGGLTGVYKCKKCGFQSAIFPEIEINEKDNKKKK